MGNIELADVLKPFEFQHFRNVRSQKDFMPFPSVLPWSRNDVIDRSVLGLGILMLLSLFAHWIYSSECGAENHGQPVPCDKIVVKWHDKIFSRSPCERRPMASALSV